MTQKVTRNGVTHYFPDDASLDEINNALSQKHESSLLSAVKSIAPSIPSGINIATGMMSMAFPGESGNAVANLPQVMRGTQPTKSESISQEIGKFLPGLEAGGSAAVKAGKGIAKGTSKGISYLQPGKIAEEFRFSLGQGTTKENINALGDMIKSQKDKFTTEGKKLYESVFKQGNVGEKPIYRTESPSGISQASKREKPPINLDVGGDLGEKIKTFNKNPSLQNAHDLQSLLGSEASNIKPLNNADRQLISKYRSLQKEISGDIHTFLKREGENLSDKYKNATNFWKNNVIPYDKKGTIKKLASGESEDVTSANIGSTFTKLTPHVKKILSDIGEEGSKKILYNAIQTVKPGQAEDMANLVLELKRTKGYDHYIPKEMEKWANHTLKQVRYANAIKSAIAGTSLGATLGPVAGAVGAALPYAGKLSKGALEIAKRLKK